MGSVFSKRWDSIKKDIRLSDLIADGFGKFLLGFGIGTLIADLGRAYSLAIIAAGILLIVRVKSRYWKKFWSS
jgi:hypothetical protein